MPSKVILKVTRGELSGKEFTYSEKEQLFVGRQEDCAIVLPDKSVSRYHCMLEVTSFVEIKHFCNQLGLLRAKNAPNLI